MSAVFQVYFVSMAPRSTARDGAAGTSASSKRTATRRFMTGLSMEGVAGDARHALADEGMPERRRHPSIPTLRRKRPGAGAAGRGTDAARSGVTGGKAPP